MRTYRSVKIFLFWTHITLTWQLRGRYLRKERHFSATELRLALLIFWIFILLFLHAKAKYTALWWYKQLLSLDCLIHRFSHLGRKLRLRSFIEWSQIVFMWRCQIIFMRKLWISRFSLVSRKKVFLRYFLYNWGLANRLTTSKI